MKTKILDYYYDENTGITIVKIQNKYGIFTGCSILQEEDKKYVSSFAGFNYAEIKAKISYIKKRIEILNYQIKILEDLYKSISQSKKFNFNSYESRKIRRKIYELHKEKKDWINKRESLHSKFLKDIELREQILKKIEKKKK